MVVSSKAIFSFCQFCDVAKVVITQRKDLDKFGYKLNKRFKKKKSFFIFLATYLNHVEKSGNFSKLLIEFWLLKIFLKSFDF
jgi:hypothetical protein